MRWHNQNAWKLETSSLVSFSFFFLHQFTLTLLGTKLLDPFLFFSNDRKCKSGLEYRFFLLPVIDRSRWGIWNLLALQVHLDFESTAGITCAHPMPFFWKSRSIKTYLFLSPGPMPHTTTCRPKSPHYISNITTTLFLGGLLLKYGVIGSRQ